MTRLRFAEAVIVLALVLCLVALVAGCATPPPAAAIATPVEVRIPVAAPCLTEAQVPARPQLAPDMALEALPDYELVITIEQQRRLLREYEARASALLAACAAVKPEGVAR